MSGKRAIIDLSITSTYIYVKEILKIVEQEKVLYSEMETKKHYLTR